MHTRKAIIIGSGIAGMATAVRLAVQGFDVEVFEKNEAPGGKIRILEKDGYRFDMGPSLFTRPDYLQELFQYAGENFTDYLNWEKVDTACHFFYENGKRIKASTDPDIFAGSLEEQLNVPSLITKKYIRQSDHAFTKIGSLFMDHSLHKRKTWLHQRIFPAISALKIPYLTKSLHSYNQSQLKNPELTQLFNRYATFNGSNPYKAPAMLSMISSLDLVHGTYYPKGGMISISRAIYQLALKKQVRFHLNSQVERIIHSGSRVMGVVVDKTNILADLVVSNMDVFYTFRDLLKHPDKASRINKQERSSSALVFYWGIKKEFPELSLHNILFSRDYKAEFNSLFSTQTLFKDPTVYINITAKMEGGHAPKGKENWFVMINVPAAPGMDWEAYTAKAREFVISKINRMLQTDIEPLIETEATLNPSMLQTNTMAYRGSLYGTSSNSRLSAFFRQPNFSRNINGLYFCGGTVHPGGGIPLCLKSAAIIGKLVGEKKI